MARTKLSARDATALFEARLKAKRRTQSRQDAPVKRRTTRQPSFAWTHTCTVCGRKFEARRGHAKTCGPTCRQRLARHVGDATALRHRFAAAD